MRKYTNKILFIGTFIFSIFIVFLNYFFIKEKSNYVQELLSNKTETILSLQDVIMIEKEFIEFSYFILSISLISIFFVLLILNFLYTKLTFKIEKYITILDKITDNIFVIDLYTNKLIFINESAKNLLKYNQNDIKNIKLEDFLMPFDKQEKIDLQELQKSLYLNKSNLLRAYIKAKNFMKTPVEISFSYVESKNKQYAVAVCFDISKQLISEIQESANKEIIDEHIPISQTDIDGNITYVNRAFCDLTGYTESQLLGKKHSILKHKDTNEKTHKELWESISQNKPWKGILKNQINNQKSIWTEIKIKPMFDYLGNKIGYISTREDISDKKELEYLSEHDILTNIKNRRTFEKELKREISLSKRYEENYFGLIMIDIDNFKNINDTYGHQIGDSVLQKLSECINKNLRNSDTFARWGGEEFVILSPFSALLQLEELAKNLQTLISIINFTPVEKLTMSLGITIYKKDDTEDSIQRRVDKALYLAKERGRDRYEVL